MDESTQKVAKKEKSEKRKVKVFNKKKKGKDFEDLLIQKLKAGYENINSADVVKFGDLPLSPQTLKGLRECGYHKLTEIQKESIAMALQGKDILGAAKTGSGKTLAFLIPILEKLFLEKWTGLDGVGALVITPTRELAYQIFETVRKVGQHHDFSAGLIIGGKDLKFERNRMDQCNIIICTPGRLLQHMDENPLFDCVNMKLLVLDEADRCLDMGFEQTMNAIIANLPPKRQTLLFSATQTKSVNDLARLSLKEPNYISVHEHSEYSTPQQLIQSYVVCELKDKISILWSFIKNHPNKKIMVFLSSCKQVKYTHEIFSKLRPGTSLLALYGTLHQLRRMDIYENFCRKHSAILFATDIASRGLDFPEVHWVVQVDCPEDPETYIHRVGRTARYHRGGESLLMLLPSEVKMIEKLTEKKIPIQKIEINPVKLNNPVRKMEAFLAKDPNLKDSAQRAFVSYAKAVFLMKDKEIFDVHSLDTASFAHSLGLAIPPRIRFLQRMSNKNEKRSKPVDVPSQNKKIYFDAEDGSESEGQPSLPFSISNPDSDDDILKIKRKNHDIDLPTQEEITDMNMLKAKSKKPVTKAALAKKILKKKIVPNKKIVFDDEGEAVSSAKEKRSELALLYENENEGGIDIEKAKVVLREEDKFDKKLFREKVKAKHKEAKRKLKERKKREEEENNEFEESGSEEEPDVSWLPDPDQVYGQKSEQEIETLEREVSKSQEKNPSTTFIKHKRKGTELKSPASKKLKDVTSSLGINETEELALLLLRNK